LSDVVTQPSLPDRLFDTAAELDVLSRPDVVRALAQVTRLSARYVELGQRWAQGRDVEAFAKKPAAYKELLDALGLVPDDAADVLTR